MNKKIITIAEIVFALVFVVLLAVFMATINSKGNEANNQLSTTLESVTGTSLSTYENLDKVKGNRVIDVVKNYKTTGGEQKITIQVDTKSSKGQKYGYQEGKSDTYPEYIATSTDDKYINPNADFRVKLVYNTNDVPIGLWFTQDTLSTSEVSCKIDGAKTGTSQTTD